MRYVVLALLALTACIAQDSALAVWPIAPDLPLALLAWAVVDGDERGVLIRAWLIGVLRDLIDPGSLCFYSFAYLLLTLFFLPIRGLLFRTRGIGWASWAASASLVLAVIDSRLGGAGETRFGVLLTNAALTAMMTWPIGWLFGRMPNRLHPIGRGGD